MIYVDDDFIEKLANQIAQVVIQQLADQAIKNERDWVNQKEAMELLGIKGRATIRKLVVEGQLETSKVTGKSVLYKRGSVLALIESRNTKI